MNITLEHEDGEDILLPDMYPQHCLQNSPPPDDSLLLLANEVFKHSSRKQSNTKISTPTTIQSICWPIMKQSDCNLIAISPTGSGKTLGYVVPMIDSFLTSRTESGQNFIHGLVIVPTRELAIQVSKTMKRVTKVANKTGQHRNRKLVSLAIYGGVDRKEQIESLMRRSKDDDTCFFIAATPMRLIDLLGLDDDSKLDDDCRSIRQMFEKMQILVIDEGDRCAIATDISKQCDMIINFLKLGSISLKKYCLFSATLPLKSLEKCHEWIKKPRAVIKVDTVAIGPGKDNITQTNFNHFEITDKNTEKDAKRSLDEEHKNSDLSLIPKHITQILHVCSNHKKPKKLISTVQKIRAVEMNDNNRRRKGLIIIFFGRIKTLEYIHNLFVKENVPCVPFHSKMSQEKREIQLNSFRSGKLPILLATDIASRGIHCNNVEYIINYDFPGSIEQYVHRCGRSGRNKVSCAFGAEDSFMKATVYSFFHRELAPLAKDMIGILRSTDAWVDPNLIELIPAQERREENNDMNFSRRKRRKTKQSVVESTSSVNNCNKETQGLSSDTDDDFAGLCENRITLQRASHVPLNSSDDESAL